MSPLINCFLVRYLRYAKKMILEISNICLWLFFSYVLISNQNPSKSTDSVIANIYLVSTASKKAKEHEEEIDKIKIQS